MEIYIQLILVLACIKYCLNATLSGRFWIIILYGTIAALIALTIYPIVIQQAVTLVTTFLSDKHLVANAAVLTTIEAIAGIFISVFLLDNYFMRKEKRKKSAFMLKVLPGILSCIGIAYFELMFFKWRVGADFMETALLYSIIVFTSVIVIASFMRYALKGESLKLEFKVLLNIGILFIGLLVNASIADYNLSYADIAIEWEALGVLGGLVILLFFIGIYLPKINIKKLLYKNT